jgi:hypothetical protein
MIAGITRTGPTTPDSPPRAPQDSGQYSVELSPTLPVIAEARKVHSAADVPTLTPNATQLRVDGVRRTAGAKLSACSSVVTGVLATSWILRHHQERSESADAPEADALVDDEGATGRRVAKRIETPTLGRPKAR